MNDSLSSQPSSSSSSVVVVAINGDSWRDGCSRFDWTEIQDYSGQEDSEGDVRFSGFIVRSKCESRIVTLEASFFFKKMIARYPVSLNLLNLLN